MAFGRARVAAAAIMALGVFVAGASAPARAESSRVLQSGEQFSVVGALGELPVGPEQFDIATAEINVATRAAGLARPNGFDDPQLSEWAMDLVLGRTPVVVRFPALFHAFPIDIGRDVVDSVGWFGLTDANAFVSLSYLPPGTGLVSAAGFTVVAGGFGESSFGPGVTPLSDDVFTYGTGDDFEGRPSQRGLDVLGRPIRMAAADGRLAAGHDASQLAEWRAGTAQTLATDGSLLVVAGELDARGAVSAVLSRGDFSSPGTERSDAARVSHPFTTTGIGWTATSAVIAYAFADASAAGAAAAELEVLYREGTPRNPLFASSTMSAWLTLQCVVVSGSTVVVTVTEHPAGATVIMLDDHDIVFTHTPT